MALGRLANYSDELAEAVVSNEILPQLVYSLSEQNVSYKNNLNFEKWAFCLNLTFEYKPRTYEINSKIFDFAVFSEVKIWVFGILAAIFLVTPERAITSEQIRQLELRF